MQRADAPGEMDAVEKRSTVRRRPTTLTQKETMVMMGAETAAVMTHIVTLTETTSRLMRRPGR